MTCAGYLRYPFDKSLVEWSVWGISIEDVIIFGQEAISIAKTEAEVR
jgi:hypothetical protein